MQVVYQICGKARHITVKRKTEAGRGESLVSPGELPSAATVANKGAFRCPCVLLLLT